MPSKDLVVKISNAKKEPEWMLAFRLESLRKFFSLKMPGWSPAMSGLKYDEINFFHAPKTKISCVPEGLRKTLAGYELQYDSEAVYNSILKKIANQGVLFTDTDTALKKYPEIFNKYFGNLIPASDNKFAALNSAFWSGGSFVYVPPGVKVALPLQAYFKINTKNIGQFERTLIIADKDSSVTYLEGCSAELSSTASLHAGVVEIFVGEGARVKYITTQNWSNEVYNLVTKRARVEERAVMSWLDVNFGSKITLKYPSCLLVGKGAKGEMLSLAVARQGQIQDTGAKMIHLAPNTTSTILSKSISSGGGQANFRGLIKINSRAVGAQAKSKCESLILDDKSGSQSYPSLEVGGNQSVVSHEAIVSKLEEEQLFYLMSRGLTREIAESLIVNGFADPVIKELPIEYGMEIKRLLDHD